MHESYILYSTSVTTDKCRSPKPPREAFFHVRFWNQVDTFRALECLLNHFVKHVTGSELCKNNERLKRGILTRALSERTTVEGTVRRFGKYTSLHPSMTRSTSLTLMRSWQTLLSYLVCRHESGSQRFIPMMLNLFFKCSFQFTAWNQRELISDPPPPPCNVSCWL